MARLSRPQVVKQLWAYIKAHELQNPANKRQIVCDAGLRAVFGAERIDMFQMNKVLGQCVSLSLSFSHFGRCCLRDAVVSWRAAGWRRAGPRVFSFRILAFWRAVLLSYPCVRPPVHTLTQASTRLQASAPGRMNEAGRRKRRGRARPSFDRLAHLVYHSMSGGMSTAAVHYSELFSSLLVVHMRVTVSLRRQACTHARTHFIARGGV